MANDKHKRYTAYLVAVTPVSESDSQPADAVYAAVLQSPGEALAAVRALLEGEGRIAVVGSLSPRTTKAINLRPGEVRAI
ncbi:MULTISPECIES: hypothetical protein [Methylobacterium]|uniref:hypothetical protein n=1 Tax=Methylobacterium TaxID=407 RepID=UPI0010476767|nr:MULTISPECIES: hypothetical protein [Methylobacterium]MDR7039904.1 uncharacterized protein YgbK (DUF1537 family) [Methylobacterium sp. BE186]